jgi:mono/diheme cytochrome c family protein
VIGAIAATARGTAHAQQAPQDPFVSVYRESCSSCHGEKLEGAAQGPALAGSVLRHGDSIEQISRSIASGFPDAGMPAWWTMLDATKIQRLAIYISETRHNFAYTDFKVATPPVIKLAVHDEPREEAASDLVVARADTRQSGCDLASAPAPVPENR